jgi:prefoldin subunit 4
MLAKEDEKDEVEVRKVDQEAINEFGRLNNRVSELRDELKNIEKELTAYEDAEEEVMLIEGEDEALKLSMGDCFLDVEEADIENELERLKEIAQKKKDQYAEEVSQCEERQTELKAQLYGRFGKTINLEE